MITHHGLLLGVTRGFSFIIINNNNCCGRVGVYIVIVLVGVAKIIII